MKKIVSVITVLAVIISMLTAMPVFADTATTGTINAFGYDATKTDDEANNALKDAITWKWDESTKTARLNNTESDATAEMPMLRAADRPYNSYASAAEKVVFENGITKIGEWTFADFSALKSIVFPTSGLNRIGSYAFSGCKALGGTDGGHYLVIPEGVTEIGEAAFNICQFNDIQLPQSLKKVGPIAFGISRFDKFVIPKNVTSLGRGVVQFVNWATGESNQKSIIFENGRDEDLVLNSDVFAGLNDSVTEVYLPKKVKIDDAVTDATALFGAHTKADNSDETMYTKTGNMTIYVADDDTYSKLNSLTYSQKQQKPAIIKANLDTDDTYTTGSMNVKYDKISSNGFYSYNKTDNSLELYGTGKYDVDLTQATNKPSRAWDSFTDDMANAVKSVKLAYGVTTTPFNIANVFPNAEVIEIPYTATIFNSIGDASSKGNIKEIIIPDSLTTINSFYMAKNLSKVTIKDKDGNIISKDGIVTLPKCVTQWPSLLFGECTSLYGTAIIPNTVTSVGNYALRSTNIDNVVFESGNTNKVTLGENFVGSVYGADQASNGVNNFKGIVMPEQINTMSSIFSNVGTDNANGINVIFPGDVPGNWNKATVFGGVKTSVNIYYLNGNTTWNGISAKDFHESGVGYTITALDTAKANYEIQKADNSKTANLFYYCGSAYNQNENFAFILAAYKANELKGIEIKDGKFAANTNAVSNPVNVTSSVAEDGVTYKAFLWDGIATMIPLINAQ